MMDIWDIESRISGLTSGSRETLDDLELVPLEQTPHHGYRGSTDVLGLEVPSMELWDEDCGPNDGFGFCGGANGFIPPKKWRETDDSSSSGVHCEDADIGKTGVPTTPSSVTCVKSVDDYGSAESAPKQRRYRKQRTKHGRYATVDTIDFEPSQIPIESAKAPKEEHVFKRQTGASRSLNHIVRDDFDQGSVTNFFVCGRSEASCGSGSQPGESSKPEKGHNAGKASLFPYGNSRVWKSSSCDELSPRHAGLKRTSSNSQLLFVEPTPAGGNVNPKGHTRKRSSIFSAVAWLTKPQDSLLKDRSKSCESVNAYVPDDPTDLKAMTNVKVIAIENYTALGAHELSFKKGQKIKLKQPSMDGGHAFGWKRTSRLGGKKYGYFPLSHVKLYEKH